MRDVGVAVVEGYSVDFDEECVAGQRRGKGFGEEFEERSVWGFGVGAAPDAAGLGE